MLCCVVCMHLEPVADWHMLKSHHKTCFFFLFHPLFLVCFLSCSMFFPARWSSLLCLRYSILFSLACPKPCPTVLSSFTHSIQSSYGYMPLRPAFSCTHYPAVFSFPCSALSWPVPLWLNCPAALNVLNLTMF